VKSPVRYMLAVGLALIVGCKETESVRCISWSPDGRFIAYSAGNRLLLADVAGRRPAIELDREFVVGGCLSWIAMGEEVVYTSDQFGGYDIVAVDISSHRRRRLTTHPAKDYAPVASPRTSMVYFVSYRRGQADIWRIPALSRDAPVQMTDDDGIESCLALGGDDDRYMAYFLTHADGSGDLILRETLHGETKTVMTGLHYVHGLSFDAEAARLAVVADGAVRVVSVSGVFGESAWWYPGFLPQPETVSRVADGTYASWRPGGARGLAVCHEGDIFLIEFGMLAGRRRLTRNPARDILPVWSPDGERLAYATGFRNEEYDFDFASALALLDPEKLTRTWLVNSADDVRLALLAYEVCMQEGNAEEAVALLEPMRGRTSLTTDVMTRLAAALIACGRYDQAADVYREELSDPVEAAEIYLFYQRDVDKAVDAFRAASARHPAAKRYLDRVEELSDRALSLLIDAKRYSLVGDFKRALAARQKFIEGFPDDSVTERFCFEVGDILLRNLHNPAAALAAYKDARRRYPQSRFGPGALESEAGILEGMARYADAFDRIYRLIGLTSAEFARANLYAQAFELALYRLKSLVLGEKLLELYFSQPFREKGLAAKLCADVLERYDRAGFHDEGTRALLRVMVRHEMAATDVMGVVTTLRHVDTDKILRGRLSLLPGWFRRRLEALAAHGDHETFKDNLHQIVEILWSGSPAQVEAAWVAAREGLLSSLATKHAVGVSTGMAYILGNAWQTAGQPREAIRWYDTLVEITDDPTYGRVLTALSAYVGQDEASNERAQEALAFLNLERDAAQEFWGSCLYLLKALTADASRVNQDELKTALLEERRVPALEHYERLADRLAGTSMGVFSAYRTIQIAEEFATHWPPGSPERDARLQDAAARAFSFVSDYPESPFASECLAGLVNNFRMRAAYIQCVGTLKDLSRRLEIRKPRPMRALATAAYWAGKVLQDDLLKPERSVVYYRSVYEDYPDSVHWADASTRLAKAFSTEGQYGKAVAVAEAVISRASQSDWVSDGTAMLFLARNLERLNEWNRAEALYLDFLEGYPEHPEALAGDVLIHVLPDLGEEATRRVNEKMRPGLVAVWDRLDRWTTKKLTRRGIPEPTSEELEGIENEPL